MSNPNDVTRDAILRHLYAVHKKARSPRSAALLISELTRALKTLGYRQQDVASNLDYLVQKGWVREVTEERKFTTARGTTQSAERITYKISDTGIDRLEAASMYQRDAVATHVNITNIRGVTVVGEGNIVNTTFTDLSRVLNEMKQAVLNESQLSDDQKLNIVSDVEALQAQLQKPEPQRSVIQTLWSGIEKVAAVGGVVELAHTAAKLIEPLLK